MDLANYKDIPPLERLFVDQIFGYLAWIPCYVALLDHLQRRHRRKSVDFYGVYLHHRTGSKATCFIHDISYSGLRFTVNRKNDIQVPDKIRLSINFNDQGERNVEKSALVRHVEMKRVGVEFIRWP